MSVGTILLLGALSVGGGNTGEEIIQPVSQAQIASISKTQNDSELGGELFLIPYSEIPQIAETVAPLPQQEKEAAIESPMAIPEGEELKIITELPETPTVEVEIVEKTTKQDVEKKALLVPEPIIKQSEKKNILPDFPDEFTIKNKGADIAFPDLEAIEVEEDKVEEKIVELPKAEEKIEVVEDVKNIPKVVVAVINPIEKLLPVKRPWADYMTQNLPPILNQKVHNSANRHLPEAMFELEYQQAVFVTIGQNNINNLRSIIRRVKNIDNIYLNGMTPLVYAINSADIRMITLLLANSIDINQRDERGFSPIHVAVFKGRLDAVIELINWGADVNIATEQGESALDIALRNGRLDIAGVIQKAGGFSVSQIRQARNY
jgi:hypothetical protein